MTEKGRGKAIYFSERRRCKITIQPYSCPNNRTNEKFQSLLQNVRGNQLFRRDLIHLTSYQQRETVFYRLKKSESFSPIVPSNRFLFKNQMKRFFEYKSVRRDKKGTG